jgi:methanogenic corrinoid protein MtbC1
MDQNTAAELRRVLEERLAAHDRAGAVESAVDAVHAGTITVADLYVLVLGPLLAEIGSAWAHGTERVWEEHLASHAVRTIVESLYLDVRREAGARARRGVTVVLACPPKEQHELGLRMLSDRFDLGGYDVVFLGADTPVEEIVSAARASGASLVALSVSTVYERVAFRTFVEEMQSALPGVRIVVGGPAFQHEEHWPAEDFLSTAELDLPGSPDAG